MKAEIHLTPEQGSWLGILLTGSSVAGGCKASVGPCSRAGAAAGPQGSLAGCLAGCIPQCGCAQQRLRLLLHPLSCCGKHAGCCYSSDGVVFELPCDWVDHHCCWAKHAQVPRNILKIQMRAQPAIKHTENCCLGHISHATPVTA